MSNVIACKDVSFKKGRPIYLRKLALHDETKTSGDHLQALPLLLGLDLDKWGRKKDGTWKPQQIPPRSPGAFKEPSLSPRLPGRSNASSSSSQETNARSGLAPGMASSFSSPRAHTHSIGFLSSPFLFFASRQTSLKRPATEQRTSSVVRLNKEVRRGNMHKKKRSGSCSPAFPTRRH